MKFNLKSKSLKTTLSVIAAITLVFIFMGAGNKKHTKLKIRQDWGGAVFSYGGVGPDRFSPAEVASPANWYVTYQKCQSNYDRYPCTFVISAPEDSMTHYTDFLTAFSRLKIETSNTDTAYVTGVVDNLYPDAPMEVYIYNGYSPYGD